MAAKRKDALIFVYLFNVENTALHSDNWVKNSPPETIPSVSN